MDTYQKYLQKAIQFLSYRPRSEKEVRDKLLRHSGKRVRRAHPESDSINDLGVIIDQVIEKLKQQKFINDEEFARMWIEQRTQFKPRSMRVIKMELKQKGISQEIIESRIKNQELSEDTDLKQAKRLVQKRMQRYKGLEKRELYEKLGRFLASKGFDWDTIKKSVDEVVKEGV